MSAILGNFLFDLVDGAPPSVKSTVELLYRPGQSTAAAKILPNQSQSATIQAQVYVPRFGSHAYADAYRGVVGGVLPFLWGGVNWGPVLVQDATLLSIEDLIAAHGRHPDGTTYSHSPASKITSRWTLVRLSL